MAMVNIDNYHGPVPFSNKHFFLNISETGMDIDTTNGTDKKQQQKTYI